MCESYRVGILQTFSEVPLVKRLDFKVQDSLDIRKHDVNIIGPCVLCANNVNLLLLPVQFTTFTFINLTSR